MGVEEEVQAKGIENIFNKIIAENFPNLEKEMVIHVQEVFRTPNRQEQKRNSPYHFTVKTLVIKNKKRNIESCKRNTKNP
jgi:hypothetical protein